MTLPETLLLSLLIVVLAKSFAWILQKRWVNGAVVDPIWAWSLGGLAVVYALAGSAPVELRGLLGLMGGLWGLRLGLHLWRRLRGRPEDFRYAQLRREWGDRADLKLYGFFQFQNVFTLLLATSAFAAVTYRPDFPPRWAMAAAVIIWLVAVIGEGVADAQMETFRRRRANRGQVCRTGLWRYSRHPNYFFECLHWLAYAPLAIGAPYGWTVLIAPLVMAFLLTKLSGMPLMEAEMARRKQGYADYRRVTSALIPWPPKRRS